MHIALLFKYVRTQGIRPNNFVLWPTSPGHYVHKDCTTNNRLPIPTVSTLDERNKADNSISCFGVPEYFCVVPYLLFSHHTLVFLRGQLSGSLLLTNDEMALINADASSCHPLYQKCP
ncbi:hypothetical protein EG68_02032 [Paragonimus skrjabini miyazakii]|uniref:Uncharacterized protein n=1 Tax=Paragonimus skrjabini miyazakii TaxID=59628 RepID=A0A8S9Z556_9TREM|nr:hypothetical protein EG68_02032 [Paragonimus skrjabini miyazakii]